MESVVPKLQQNRQQSVILRMRPEPALLVDSMYLVQHLPAQGRYHVTYG
jgi:hypothetical protein